MLLQGAYLTEEESTRLLEVLRKQGFDPPIFGEMNIMYVKVVELAGKPAYCLTRRVGLTVDAPKPLIKVFSETSKREIKARRP